MSRYYCENKHTKVVVIRTSYQEYVNYVYLCIDKGTQDAFVVDPAWNIYEIEQCIKEEGARLTQIFLTHSHIDHINLADCLAKKFNIPVYMSQREIDFYTFNCENLIGLGDNESIAFGMDEIKSFITPGHTAGSTCYLVGELLFCGDTLFIEGCGDCRFSGGSPEMLYDSIHFLKKNISDTTLVFPGHKFKAEVGRSMSYVKENNVYFYARSKEQFVKMKSRYNRSNCFYGR